MTEAELHNKSTKIIDSIFNDHIPNISESCKKLNSDLVYQYVKTMCEDERWNELFDIFNTNFPNKYKIRMNNNTIDKMANDIFLFMVNISENKKFSTAFGKERAFHFTFESDLQYLFSELYDTVIMYFTDYKYSLECKWNHEKFTTKLKSFLDTDNNSNNENKSNNIDWNSFIKNEE